MRHFIFCSKYRGSKNAGTTSFFIRKIIETEHEQRNTLPQGFTPTIFSAACNYYQNIQTWLDLIGKYPDDYQPYIFLICAQLAIKNHISPCNYFFNAATVFLITDACRAAQLYYQAAAYAETDATQQQRYLRNALFAFKQVAAHHEQFYITSEIRDQANAVIAHTIGEDQLKSEVKIKLGF